MQNHITCEQSSGLERWGGKLSTNKFLCECKLDFCLFTNVSVFECYGQLIVPVCTRLWHFACIHAAEVSMLITENVKVTEDEKLALK